MRVTIEQNAYPPEFASFFPRCKTDFGFEAVVQSAISKEWYGIVVTDGERAFAHTVAPKPIPGTPWCDVDAVMCYTGFLTTSHEFRFSPGGSRRVFGGVPLVENRCRVRTINPDPGTICHFWTGRNWRSSRPRASSLLPVSGTSNNRLPIFRRPAGADCAGVSTN